MMVGGRAAGGAGGVGGALVSSGSGRRELEMVW